MHAFLFPMPHASLNKYVNLKIDKHKSMANMLPVNKRLTIDLRQKCQDKRLIDPVSLTT